MAITKHNYEEYIRIAAQITTTHSKEILLNQLQFITNALGFDNYVLGIEVLDSHGKAAHHTLGNYPEAWVKKYAENNFATFDPTVLHCQKSTVPIFWSERTFADPKCLSLFEEAKSYGLDSGVSVSAHGRRGVKSMISMSNAHQHRYTLGEINNLKSIATVLIACAHLTVERILLPSLITPIGGHLTKQERECLAWVASGKTAWEIGKIINISESTVVFHIKNVLEKLGAANRQQAVALGIRAGLID